MKPFPYNAVAGGQRVRAYTRDNMLTFDRATIDSTGAFLNGELERLDQTLHMPLVQYTWMRDIDLREDVSNADEVSSFTNSTFASAPGITGKGGLLSGKSWAGKNTNAITGISLDIGKTANPLTIWAEEIQWSLPELASAERLGRPIDTQKYEGLKLKQNMDIDAQVYGGDADMGFVGLFNNTNVTANAVAAGASGSKLWTQKTPAEILQDVNSLLTATWAAAGWAVIPDQLRLPPDQFSYINSQIVSVGAGNISILEFLRLNNLVRASAGKELNIQPVKWLIGMGTGGTIGTADGHNRMVAYNKEVQYVRFPMTLLQRTPIENRGLYQITTYWNRLGVVEFVYPTTVQYADGIG